MSQIGRPKVQLLIVGQMLVHDSIDSCLLTLIIKCSIQNGLHSRFYVSHGRRLPEWHQVFWLLEQRLVCCLLILVLVVLQSKLHNRLSLVAGNHGGPVCVLMDVLVKQLLNVSLHLKVIVKSLLSFGLDLEGAKVLLHLERCQVTCLCPR